MGATGRKLMMKEEKRPVGRFAPSPSGRMHLGNMMTALVSWMSVKLRGGEWVLRIEDLDPQRSRLEYAELIEDDLHWAGLIPDRGGLAADYRQSLRHEYYEEALKKLDEKGMLYPCRCRRVDIMATQAPHQSDGRIVYQGTCRPGGHPPFPSAIQAAVENKEALRIFAPDRTLSFKDILYGQQSVNLAHHCGDFVLRRADGAWAYQLAVVVDDALMGITEVCRGEDLLLSSAQQIFLYNLLGYKEPEFLHLPLVRNTSGQRLSKRDSAMAMDALRKRMSPSRLIGLLAEMAGLVPSGSNTSVAPFECTPADLLSLHTYDSFLSALLRGQGILKAPRVVE